MALRDEIVKSWTVAHFLKSGYRSAKFNIFLMNFDSYWLEI